MHCIHEMVHACMGHILTNIQHQKWSTDKSIISEQIRKQMPHWTCWWPSKCCKSQCWSHFTRSFISTWTYASSLKIGYSTLHLQTHGIFQCLTNPSHAEQQFIMPSLPFTLHTQAVLFTHVCVCDIFGFTTYIWHMHMIRLQVHLRKPCYEFSCLAMIRFKRFSIALFK